MSVSQGSLFNLDDDDDEHTWVQSPFSPSNALHVALRDWESSARCPICRDFFNIPVSIIPCHHSFCSECIRNSFKAGLKSLKRQAACPVCRVQVSATGADFKCLVPNRSVETMVKKYQALRKDLRQSLAQVSNSSNVAANDSNHAVTTADAPQMNMAGTKRSRDASLSYAETTMDDDNSDDHCQNADAEETTHAVRKKRARTHYNGLKRKQLADLCAAEGLSTAGSEQELRSRHEAFITLYNAECDSFHPRTAQELVAEFERREKARKVTESTKLVDIAGYYHHLHDLKLIILLLQNEAHLECHNGAVAQSKYFDNLKKNLKEGANPGVITSGNAEFDYKLKSNFAKLAAECKKRMITAKKPTGDRNDQKPPPITAGVQPKDDAVAAITPASETGEWNDAQLSCVDSSIAEVKVSPNDTVMVCGISRSVPDNQIVGETEPPTTTIPTTDTQFPPSENQTPLVVIPDGSDGYPVVQQPTDAAARPRSLSSPQGNAAMTADAYITHVQSCTPPSTVTDTASEPTSKASRRTLTKQKSIDQHFQVLTNTRADSAAKLPRKRPTRTIHEPWDCLRCTFRNVTKGTLRYSTQCEMCGAHRADPNGEKVQE